MNIFDHFQHINLTNDQRHALEKFQAFLESDERVFILQGYAGTGKTTLLKGLVEYLKFLKKNFELMAPTGRAAKILRDKTGYGQTIHKTIYNFKELKTIQHQEEDDYSFHYFFPIREIESDGTILIVDEASMISNIENKNELYTFGTDKLLDDLLTYSKIPYSDNKILLVGDPAQLPPVGDNTSKALLPEYFNEIGIKTTSFTLQQVVRQSENTILQNSFKIRSLIGAETRNNLQLSYDSDTFIKIASENIVTEYVNQCPVPTLGQSVIISYSNTQCYEYNKAIRKTLFPDKFNVTQGDLLIITHNNYHTYNAEMMNGELCLVMEADDTVITRKNIPVYETINGQRIKKHVTLNFRNVKIRLEHYGDELNCLIIDSLLHSPHRDLTPSEMKALYVDFVMRFKEEQKRKKERGLPTFEVGSEEFKKQLQNDKFFNALRVKYGYAITCHKAQGGEWNTVFIDYYGRNSLKDDSLRWAYTATTRAVHTCYAANAPHFSPFSRFSINKITSITDIPDNALALERVPVSPFHTENHHRAKSLKYWEVEEKLENSPFQVVAVKTLSNFHERYTITYQDVKDIFDVFHDSAGIFNDFEAVHPGSTTWQNDVLIHLNRPHRITYNINYTPSEPFLENLYSLMQSICSELHITITNIIERINDYHVIYFLKTDAKCSLIQFYFNQDRNLTRALPRSTSGIEDQSLKLLISKINNYVI